MCVRERERERGREERHRRANLAHTRHTGKAFSGLGFQANVLNTFYVVPFSHHSGFGCGVSPRATTLPGFGLRFSGFGFRVSGFGFRVSGFEFRVQCSRFRVPCSGFRVWNSEFRVSNSELPGSGFRVSKSGLRIPGFEFRVSGFRVPGRCTRSRQTGRSGATAPLANLAALVLEPATPIHN